MGGMENWDHDRFMDMALDQAMQAWSVGEVPVGAVLVDRQGEVIARAHNEPISTCDPTAHAEVAALRKASRVLRNYRLPGTILYVTIEPCAMCVGAMLHARIEWLVYGASDPKAGAAGSIVDLTNVPLFNHHIKVVRGIRADACKQILREFFALRRRAGK